MASGSFNVSTSNQYISGYVSWSSTPNTEGNYSTVSMTLYISRNNTGFTTYRIPRITFTIEGQSYYYDAGSNQTFTYNSNTYCGSYTRDVPHSADGSFVCSLAVSGTLYSSSGSYTVNSTSQNVTLDTIPRASSPTLSGTGVMETVLTIYTNKLASFTHTIRYSFSSLSGTIATGVVDSCTWTIPINFANQIPNATSGYGTIYCDTYSGGTLIGTKTVGFTAWLPDSIVPSFTSITGSELNSSVSSIVGKYVQRLSNIRLTINGAVGTYGSTITAYNINYYGTNYGASSIDTGTIGWSGNQTVTATITDSRGRTAQRTLALSALAYNYPSITTFSVARYSDTNSDGIGDTPNDMGTYARITTIATVSSLINSTEKNTLTYTLYSKARTTPTWTTIKTATTISGLSLNTANTLGTYTATSSFDFRLDVTDKFNTTMSLTVLSTGLVCMSLAMNGVGIGKVYEQGTVDIGGDAYISGNLRITNGFINASVSTPNTINLYTNYYSKIASLSITNQYADAYLSGILINNSDGSTIADETRFYVRVKQQNAMGSAPNVDMQLQNGKSFFNVTGVLASNTASLTQLDIYVQITQGYTIAQFFPIAQYGSVAIYSSTLIQSLPAGTKYQCYVKTYDNNIGQIAYFARSTIPFGWLKCNGSAISRTAYKNLFDTIGINFGAGDGSTTFNIPDLRGVFIRGLDDGRGIDTGRVFGSLQDDDFKAHDYHIDHYGGTHYVNSNTYAQAYPTSQFNVIEGNELIVATMYVGGTETRPKNVALLACIKY